MLSITANENVKHTCLLALLVVDQRNSYDGKSSVVCLSVRPVILTRHL